MIDDHNGDGDYVLVHKSKAKISRARKFIIGTMMVGAVAAITGAGTFASFSASTSNDATFSTTRLALSNSVNGNTACTSPAAKATGPGSTGTQNTDVDTNDEECDTLFPDDLTPGDPQTATVDVSNTSNDPADLYLFATAACKVDLADPAFDAGSYSFTDPGNLCDRVQLSIQDTTDGACVYGADVDTNDVCDVLDDSTTGQSFSDFSSTHDFDGKLPVATGLDNTAHQFVITVLMTTTKGVNCTGLPDSDVDTGTVDGFGDATGIGCDNKYMNQKADMSFRWQIQA
jgi:hypothetical protein